ncbi:MAG: hypothetical protein K8F91_26860 [Candidatus Obscuribacterales bacterium]|nr:hypothetical protein [Candidatus Obscuribacterales bacterium]
MKQDKLDALFNRWRGLFANSISNDEDLAAEGIRLLYQRVGKRPPKLILWCESPFQFSLYPLLLCNLLISDQWHELVANLGTGPAAKKGLSLTSDWHVRWSHEWERVEDAIIKPIIESVCDKHFPDTSDTLKLRLRAGMERDLYRVLLDGKVSMGQIFEESRQAMKFKDTNIHHAPTTILDIWKHQAKLAAKIERRTRQDFTFSLPSSLGLMLGEFDYRILTQHIPIARELLQEPIDESLSKELEQLRTRSEELEAIAMSRTAWLNTIILGSLLNINHSGFDTNQPWTALAAEGWQRWRQLQEELSKFWEVASGVTTATWSTELSFLPFALACRIVDPDLLADLEDDIDCWAYLSIAAAGYYFTDEVCFVCAKPTTLSTNEVGRPHDEKRAAARWADGFSIHSWRGVIVDAELIKNKTGITISMILAEKNAVIRQVMLDIYGEERFLKESRAEIIHQDECGTLLRHSFPGDEPLLMVRVKNSTAEPDGTFKDYYLRVPPHMERARQAVAWTFGVAEADYEPCQQT